MDKIQESKHGVMVIGGHVQGLGITRIYGKNKIPVVLLDTNKFNLTRHSKYCQDFILYSENKLFETLISLSKDNKYKDWLLMPTNDREVEILADNKILLSKYYKISTADNDVLDFFFNKRKTYNLAKELKIPIPETWMPNNWDEIEKLNITFPCIIKPAIMHTFYSKTKKKVFVCNDMPELKINYNKAVSIIPIEEVIIQDIIPGNSEHQYSVCFMFDGIKPLVTLSARRARQHPPDFGNATTCAETVLIPDLIETAKSILKDVGYIGVCEVEFKYDVRDNTFKFLEVNPRTWKWHSISEKSNSPFLLSLYNNTYALAPIVKNSQEEATFRHLITDLPTIFRMILKGQKVSKSHKNIKLAVWDNDDLIPAFFELFYLPYFIFSR